MMARPAIVLGILILLVVIAALCVWQTSPSTLRWGVEHLQREAGKGEVRPPCGRRKNKFVLHEHGGRVIAGASGLGTEM